MTSQVVCRGCRCILLYKSGATKVSCAICSTVTSIPPPGKDMDYLICGGCKTLLMYERGAKTVKCSCCDIVNLAPAISSSEMLDFIKKCSICCCKFRACKC